MKVYAYHPTADFSEKITVNQLRKELRRAGKAQQHSIEQIKAGKVVKTDFAEYSRYPRGRVL